MDDISRRYKTLPLEKLDTKHVGAMVCDQWNKINEQRQEMLEKREEWTANWRDLNAQRSQGPWENASNFHIPLTLINGKAIHARLWQLFSDLNNFFGVKARREAFEDREQAIKEFMTFLMTNYCNSKHGVKDVFDEHLWDTVFDGGGFLKLYMQREVHQYLEVVPKVTVKERTVFDAENLTGRVETDAKMEEVEEMRTEVIETPHIKRILMEDILLPKGEGDPQTSRWVQHRVFMAAEDLKLRAQEGKFEKSVVETILEKAGVNSSLKNSITDQIKDLRDELDGYYDPAGITEDGMHGILEWYGKVYVEREITDDVKENVEKLPQEVVVWVHQATRKVLGWTYLYRISPSGIRPIFRSDFIRFPDRSHGVGVAEVLAPINQAIDAVYNLRQDNGVMASTPFGVYRASSGLKPDKLQVEPSTLLPVDDVNDVRFIQTPFLQGFGYQEEDRLNAYGERILTISDIQLGRTPAKVGMFRTASGAGAIQQESGIQLEIHFDRLARTMSRLLQALFILARERMPSELYYRVTGETGEPIFGKVNREDLKGEYDFEINVDILGESRIEGQQKAVLMMQTLINPAFTQTGVVTPDNLYHLAKNFLIKHKIRRIDNYLAKPQGYQGEVVTPSERVFRIVVNAYMNPPIEDTVRMAENHEEALKFYEGFEQSDEYGLLTQPEQLAALDRLKKKHMQMMMAVQAGSNPNMTGMQTPRDGFAPVEAGGMDQGTLGAPMGEMNGPVA